MPNIPRIRVPEIALGKVAPYRVDIETLLQEERALSRKRETRRFWLGLILGFVLGVAAGLTANYIWRILGA